MNVPTKIPFKVSCLNEYDPLQQVILCPPRFMKIREVINWTQRHFAEENIDQEKALSQYNLLLKTLKEHQVEVIELSPDHEYPEQVFTRDIGFTLGNTLFIARLDRAIRQGEEKVLESWLKEHGIPFEKIEHDSIEGGDVLLDRDTVFIGCSHRTSGEAVKELKKKLPDYKIMTIPFSGEYLHLDCVFNIISPTTALIFSPAFDRKKDLDYLASRYELIEVSKEEQFTLGVNVLSLGHKTIIVLPFNQEVNQQLRQGGYKLVEVDISEIIKSGGSFRCITMPLCRQKVK